MKKLNHLVFSSYFPFYKDTILSLFSPKLLWQNIFQNGCFANLVFSLLYIHACNPVSNLATTQSHICYICINDLVAIHIFHREHPKWLLPRITLENWCNTSLLIFHPPGEFELMQLLRPWWWCFSFSSIFLFIVLPRFLARTAALYLVITEPEDSLRESVGVSRPLQSVGCILF